MVAMEVMVDMEEVMVDMEVIQEAMVAMVVMEVRKHF